MLDDAKVDIKIRLAALWASVMFCYVYADYFGLFAPGQVARMNQGQIDPLGPATAGAMIFVSAMMAVPSVMIALSTLLPARANRGLNLVCGTLYTAIIGVTMWSGPHFIFYGAIEVALTAAVVTLAWRWPTTTR